MDSNNAQDLRVAVSVQVIGQNPRGISGCTVNASL